VRHTVAAAAGAAGLADSALEDFFWPCTKWSPTSYAMALAPDDSACCALPMAGTGSLVDFPGAYRVALPEHPLYRRSR
jgi:hypothetical protein